MLFPQGAVVFMNLCTLYCRHKSFNTILYNDTGAIFHDHRYYDEPHKFKPERFLIHPLGIIPGVQDDPARRENLAFGAGMTIDSFCLGSFHRSRKRAGRRVCPGIRIGKASVVNRFLSSLIPTFD